MLSGVGEVRVIARYLRTGHDLVSLVVSFRYVLRGSACTSLEQAGNLQFPRGLPELQTGARHGI